MSPKPSFRDVFGAFVFYFLAQLLVAPLLFQFVHRFVTGHWEGVLGWIAIPEIHSWWNFFMILVVAAMMGLYTFYIEKHSLAVIWGKFKTSSQLPLKIFGYWCIAYFTVLIVNNGVHFLMERWVQFPVTDQMAVEQVRGAFSQPILYGLTSFSIITLVPAIEEILFRGYLQQWLKRYLSPVYSILIVAVIFAFFHFSIEQKWMNVELIAALFTFSLFLGFVRERYHSLNASIFLHGTFNGMSILFLTLQELLK